jgi:AcrR family transcriptional regulator
MARPVKPVLNLRDEQAARTRARVLDAAQHVFVEGGFAGTRIEDVAARAHVAVPTVYKIFTNKRNLLVGALSRAMVGSDAAGSVDEQTWWKQQLEEPDPARQLQLIARNARRICERAAPLLEVLHAAAPLDEELAEAWNAIVRQRLDRSRRTARSLTAKTRTTRLSHEETAVTLWSLTGPELFTSYISGGRTPEQYERWLADILGRALLADRPPPRGPGRQRAMR